MIVRTASSVRWWVPYFVEFALTTYLENTSIFIIKSLHANGNYHCELGGKIRLLKVTCSEFQTSIVSYELFAFWTYCQNICQVLKLPSCHSRMKCYVPFPNVHLWNSDTLNFYHFYSRLMQDAASANVVTLFTVSIILSRYNA